jgi:hypothetical protein
VLCAEIIMAHLQAAAILAHKKQQSPHASKPQQQHQQQQQQAAEGMEVDDQADAVASSQLRAIAKLLGVDQPPPR